MIDIKKNKTSVDKLALGMYVTELDCPWMDSPFLLQGFLLEDQEDLQTIIDFCEFVYVDHTKSTGHHYIAPPKQEVAIKREGAVVRVKAPGSSSQSTHLPAINKARSGQKVSFIEILRDLKNQNNPAGTPVVAHDVMYNVKYGADTDAKIPEAAIKAPSSSHSENDSVAKSLLNDVSNFLGGIFSKQKKLKTSTESAKAENNKRDSDDSHDPYKVTIYEEDPPVEQEIANIYPVYEQSQLATRDIFEAVANEQHVDLSAVSEVLDSMVESIGRTPDALLWLAKLKRADNQSYAQALNVSITLMAFGNFLALSKKQIKDLGLAGLLQDIGKVKISADVLHKEGKLTHEEYEYAKKHVEESLKILNGTPDISMEVLDLVAQHHERADGSGYPNQLTEDQMTIAAQATGLVDTYCAITSQKSYAKGVYHQQALDEIFKLGEKQFTRRLVDQFVQFTGMYPVSSLVELNTGEVGVVVQQNQVRRLLPRLMLLLDPQKKRYQAPVMLNLLNNPNTPNGEPYRIVKSLAPDSYGLNSADFYV